MKLTLSIEDSDLEAIAKTLEARFSGECTAAQFEAIRDQVLTKLCSQAAIFSNGRLLACSAVMSREYRDFRQVTHKLPRSRRGGGGRHT